MASKSLMMFFGWLASAVFNVILVICMYAASTVDGLAGEAKFHIVWFSFLIIGWQGASILVLKKFNTALAYGSLIGSTFAMSQFNLINGVVWAGLGSDLDSKSFKAAAAFAFIEFLGMLAFTVLLVLWKEELIDDMTDASFRPAAGDVPVGSHDPEIAKEEDSHTAI
eukprot:TRINITY_DN428_c1_g1_i1.p1 TRINITY_DN428_c1_g1~~TRINITY_DN428_c1_g1_i1.p1  ORF type:complete len:167 (+),score=49.14 TRINITY_DN428_c1_g1_i1:105-605(+)